MPSSTPTTAASQPARPDALDLTKTEVFEGGWLPGYEILHVLGAGSCGVVLAARQIALDRIVAIKVLQPGPKEEPHVAERFAQEAVALGKCHHPNIVQVFDHGCRDGRLFIAMEWLDGEDLGQRMHRLGSLDERLAWAIARQTALALAHASLNGIVHRDIKPANLFLVPAPAASGSPADFPIVKVTDFGLALTARGQTAPVEADGDGAPILGTPLYMAPEQFRGATELDHRADIYALGATLFHALAGRPPFDAATVWELMTRKLAGPPSRWPDASCESIALLKSMMAIDPADRPRTYDDLIDRIDRLPTQRPTANRAPATRWSRVLRRSARASIAAGATAMLALGTVIWLGVPAGSPSLYHTLTDDQEALFDGRSLSGWRPPQSGGVWSVISDAEGTAVLNGVGFTRRTHTPHDNFRVTIGLDVLATSTTEVHFAIPTMSPDSSRRLALRVSKTEGATLGSKEGDRGAFRPVGKPVRLPEPSWYEGRRPYLEVRLERAGNEWSATFHGTLVGRIIDDGLPKCPELRLFAEGGPARIDSVILEKLTLVAMTPAENGVGSALHAPPHFPNTAPTSTRHPGTAGSASAISPTANTTAFSESPSR